MLALFLPFLLVALSVVQGFTIETPMDWTSPGNNTLSWTTAAGDPSVFNVFLVNTQVDVLNGAFAILNTVSASSGSVVFALGVVNTDPQYQLRFTDVNANVTDALAESATFNIARLAVNGTSTRSLGVASSSASSRATSSGLRPSTSSFSSARASSASGSQAAAVESNAATTTPTSAGTPLLAEIEDLGLWACLVVGLGAFIF